MRKNTSFLTKKDFDKNQILNVLLEQKSDYVGSEKEILETIISDLKNQQLELFSPQEIHFLENNDPVLWSKYLIFRQKFLEFPKKRIVADFPNYLLIEPVSACNLRCIMCFQIDETFTKNKNLMGQMDFELFKKIIDEAFEGGTKAITIASRGEPTLHPKLGEMLEYCNGKFFELKLNTNATRLNEKLIHKILQSDVTDMVFSIDSYEKKEYESIRVKGVFEDVLSNIKKFKEIKEKSYPNSNCATRVSGVKFDSNQNQEKFKEFWERYVEHVVMVEMENRWDTYNNPTEIAGDNPCDYLWERMYVWFDGICNPCDADYKSELSVGNIQKNSLREIWNGEKYSKLRSLHLDSKRSQCHPCDRCPVGS
jgi:radical SAM protein with 4Fe4S-binding SPASM domain